jgi:hypothetical protein
MTFTRPSFFLPPSNSYAGIRKSAHGGVREAVRGRERLGTWAFSSQAGEMSSSFKGPLQIDSTSYGNGAFPPLSKTWVSNAKALTFLVLLEVFLLKNVFIRRIM